MAVTQYIGARYVPIFADPAEWTSTKQYEPLTIVLHEGNSYTSRQFVPVGVNIDNTDFWAETGNYNAQVEAYRRAVQDYASDVEAYERNLEETTKIAKGCRIFYTKNAYNTSGTNSSCSIIKTIDHAIMIDTGHETSADYIMDCLSDNDVEHIDYVVISHYHADHCGNIDRLIYANLIDDTTIFYLSRKPINNPRLTNYSESYADSIISQIAALGARIIYPNNGDSFNVDDVTIYMYNNSLEDVQYYDANTIEYNDYSIVTYLESGDFRAGFMGDIAQHAQARIYSSNYAKKCEIATVPHHGVDDFMNIDFFNSVYSEYAIAQCTAYLIGRNNTQSLPMSYLTARGLNTYLLGHDYAVCTFNGIYYDVYSNAQNETNDIRRSALVINCDSGYAGTKSDGSARYPFNTIREAIGFARRFNNCIVSINGNNKTYDEDVRADHFNEIRLNDMTINKLEIMSSFVDGNNITIIGEVDGALNFTNSTVTFDTITINGNVRSSSHAGRGIVAYNSKASISRLTVSNKKQCVNAYYGSTICIATISGSNNLNGILSTQGCSVGVAAKSNFGCENDVYYDSSCTGKIDGAIEYPETITTTQTFTDTIGANANDSHDVSVKVDGYTPVGIIGTKLDRTSGGTGDPFLVNIWRCYINNHNLVVGFHNYGAAPVDLDSKFTILHRRTYL